MSSMSAAIRPYRASDRDAVYDVCLRTADGGEDASGRFADPTLPGDVFVDPYLELCPELAFVVQREDGDVAGYAVGTLDTPGFVAAFRARWLPRFAHVPRPALSSRDREVLQLLPHPESLETPSFPAHPSHLHINLLPSVQGQGHGRALIATICEALRAAGSPGVHLGVRRRNTRALGFYPRVGFEQLHATADAVFFGRALATTGR